MEFSVLRGRRCAGRRIMEEQLFVKRGKKRLNVAIGHEGRMKEENRCLRDRAKVGGLADLASCFVLSACVGVASDLGYENNEHQGQTQSEQPSQTSSRDWSARSHLNFQTTASFL